MTKNSNQGGPALTYVTFFNEKIPEIFPNKEKMDIDKYKNKEKNHTNETEIVTKYFCSQQNTIMHRLYWKIEMRAKN